MKGKEGQVSIRAVGDNLIHKQLYMAAKNEDGSYSFDCLYENVERLIKDCDISVINQETILVRDEENVSSFPVFGSPCQVAEAVKKAGFTVVTHASNHAFDKGYTGILDSIDTWKRMQGITLLGIHDSEEDFNRIRIIEKNGIKVAMLNYTQTMNFRRIPSRYRYCVSQMKTRFKKRIAMQIQKAKSMADVVIVFPHWGCEYIYEPVKKQEKWARFFVEQGADLIVGTHPHVLQNVEMLRTLTGKDVPCLYSLGNFVSCQVKPGTMLGAMADIVIEKDKSGVKVSKAQMIPLVTHTDENYSYFTTYPLDDYSDELAEKNKIFQIVEKNFDVTVNMAYLQKLYRDILDKKAQAYNIYKTPFDVTKSNIKGVMALARGIDTKK